MIPSREPARREVGIVKPSALTSASTSASTSTSAPSTSGASGATGSAASAGAAGSAASGSTAGASFSISLILTSWSRYVIGGTHVPDDRFRESQATGLRPARGCRPSTAGAATPRRLHSSPLRACGGRGVGTLLHRGEDADPACGFVPADDAFEQQQPLTQRGRGQCCGDACPLVLRRGACSLCLCESKSRRGCDSGACGGRGVAGDAAERAESEVAVGGDPGIPCARAKNGGHIGIGRYGLARLRVSPLPGVDPDEVSLPRLAVGLAPIPLEHWPRIVLQARHGRHLCTLLTLQARNSTRLNSSHQK